jgi:hypothetical protein
VSGAAQRHSHVPLTENSTDRNAALVRHVVAWRFTANTTQAEADEVAARYLNLFNICRLPSGEPYIISLDGGTPNSKEGFQQSMQQVFIMTFSSVADRDYFVGRPLTYPFDPDHDQFKEFVGKYLHQPVHEGLIVLDFVVGGNQ